MNKIRFFLSESFQFFDGKIFSIFESTCFRNVTITNRRPPVELRYVRHDSTECKQYTFEPQHQETWFWTCAPSEDSDQPACSRSLIRIFTGHALDSQGCKVFFYADKHTWFRLRRSKFFIFYNRPIFKVDPLEANGFLFRVDPFSERVKQFWQSYLHWKSIPWNGLWSHCPDIFSIYVLNVPAYCLCLPR